MSLSIIIIRTSVPNESALARRTKKSEGGSAAPDLASHHSRRVSRNQKGRARPCRLVATGSLPCGAVFTCFSAGLLFCVLLGRQGQHCSRAFHMSAVLRLGLRRLAFHGYAGRRRGAEWCFRRGLEGSSWDCLVCGCGVCA
jgi:hypothetical protein